MDKMDLKPYLFTEEDALKSMPDIRSQIVEEAVAKVAAINEKTAEQALIVAQQARIAGLEKALERTVDQAERCLNEACRAAVEKLTEVAPHMGWDAGEETAKLHIRRVRAAALIKEAT